jgi:hypothetical protein
VASALLIMKGNSATTIGCSPAASSSGVSVRLASRADGGLQRRVFQLHAVGKRLAEAEHVAALQRP